MAKTHFKFNLFGSKPAVDVKGGVVREAKQATFPALQGMAMFQLVLRPGAVRIPHWHPNSDELNIVLEGKASITLLGPDGPGQVRETFELQKGEISFMPRGWFHSITNVGESDLTMLVIFNDGSPDDIGVSQALGAMNPQVLSEVLGAKPEVFAKLKKNVVLIAPQ